MKGRYQYFQPNKKDIKDKFGDCTIRALCKALDIEWLDAFDLMIPFCRREQIPNIFFATLDIRKKIMSEIGFSYHGVSNKRGVKRPTVETFAKDHPEGTFILNVANHEVAVVDGKYYDTWNSGYCSLYGYFQWEGEC